MMNILEVLSVVDSVLKLAEKAPHLVQGKIFVSPCLARELGIVDCQTCSDLGQIITGTQVKGCPDCNS